MPNHQDYRAGSALYSTQTAPVFADINSDGQVDLVIGSTASDKQHDGVMLFMNVGVPGTPEFLPICGAKGDGTSPAAASRGL